MRPRFFAGQLLTEDDLQLLGDYVVAKHRLHNRFLFGEGVVCGLEVTCHPCGGGQVIVQPGYALDCCGNDLMLVCPQTLDINAMVRELRRRLLGVDCGDPCADRDNPGKPTDATQGGAQGKPDDIARHYCLYIRYCEELTDPVTPYSTGEPCGAQVCEPTRVREGLQFELRCREADKPSSGLFARICQCLGDLDSTEKSTRDVRYFQVFARQTHTAVEAIRANPIPPFEDQHVTAIENATNSVGAALRTLGQSISDEQLRAVLDAILETAGLVARFYSRPREDQARLLQQHEGATLGAKLDAAKATLGQMPAHIAQDLITQTLTLPLERESAIALMEVTQKLTPEHGEPPTDDPEVRLLAEGAIFTPRVLAASTLSLDALREWLLDRLDASPHLTNCALRQAVRHVMLPPPPTRQDTGGETPTGGAQARLGLSDATAVTRSAENLASIFFRYLADCLCAALNPACAPCDDPAVLLACLEVNDCEVVRICNLERTFVLSPTAVRYWTPVDLVGKALEQACCPVAPCPDDPHAPLMSRSATALSDKLLMGFLGRSVPASLPSPLGLLIPLLSAVLSEVCGKDQAQLRWIIFSIATLFRQQSASELPAGGTAPFRAFSLLNAPTVET
jgi:hypothetical protein